MGQYFVIRFTMGDFLSKENIISVIQILDRILEMVDELASLNIFHSDIKPANIVFDFDHKEQRYKLYFIDFGSSSLDFGELNGFTPEYFFNQSTRVNSDNLLERDNNFDTV